MLVVLSGGGTAGHINPALALAEVLEERGVEVRFAGTPRGVESRLVPEAGIAFQPFEASGFNRKHPLSLVKALKLISHSTKEAKRWFSEIKPSAVVGFGGYVSIPVARAAEQIIDADAVKIGQRDERVYGIIQRTDLVLRIGILADVQQLRDLLLCVIMVDPQIADILVFQNFLSHEITRHELIVSGNQILHFI